MQYYTQGDTDITRDAERMKQIQKSAGEKVMTVEENFAWSTIGATTQVFLLTEITSLIKLLALSKV
jgi:hypothetical protein